MKMPAYQNLYMKLRTQILNGVYPAGSRLPSKRSIALDNRISLITTEHALDQLIEEGYIEARPRRGYFVIYRAPSSNICTQMISTEHSPSLQDASFPRSVYAKTARRILSEPSSAVLSKCESKGALPLREALVRYLARTRDLFIDVDQVIIGSGSEVLYQLLVCLLSRNRIFGIEDPSYEKIQRMYRALGVRVDTLKLGKNGILSSELKRTPASILQVTPYHSYPSLISADATKRSEYLQWARERNALLIEDDYDSELYPSYRPRETLFHEDPTHVLYMNTFTRTIGPGVRISYLLLPKHMVAIFDEKASYYSCSVSTLDQLIVAELLESGALERHIQRMRRKRSSLQG